MRRSSSLSPKSSRRRSKTPFEVSMGQTLGLRSSEHGVATARSPGGASGANTRLGYRRVRRRRPRLSLGERMLRSRPTSASRPNPGLQAAKRAGWQPRKRRPDQRCVQAAPVRTRGPLGAAVIFLCNRGSTRPGCGSAPMLGARRILEDLWSIRSGQGLTSRRQVSINRSCYADRTARLGLAAGDPSVPAGALRLALDLSGA